MLMDQSGVWAYRIRIFNAEKRDHEPLKECVNALFKDHLFSMILFFSLYETIQLKCIIFAKYF